MRIAAIAGALLAASGLVAGVASATHIEPVKGNLFKSNLVTAYAPCTTPATATDPPGPVQAACPAVRRDAGCGFGPKGSGKLLAKVLTDPATKMAIDITVQGILVGLDPACEGETLTLSSASRITVDDCPGAPGGCTYAANFAVGSCVVTSGKCFLESTFNDAMPGVLLIEGGKRQALELGAWSFKRGSLTTFTAGVLNP